jgi:hypothetical protein
MDGFHEPMPADFTARVEALQACVRKAASRTLTPEERSAVAELAEYLRALLDSSDDWP